MAVASSFVPHAGQKCRRARIHRWSPDWSNAGFDFRHRDNKDLINNRQNGRRRGRGGQRSQGGNPGRGTDNGNRIDNRARGNAAQLLEKYKTLARDAQMQGDRVNTEYYLQFADHYFRVLAETRSRFEENQPRGRQNEAFDSDEGDDFDGNDMGSDDGNEMVADRGNDRSDEYRGHDRGSDRGNGRVNARGNDRGNDRGNGRDFDRAEANGNRAPAYDAGNGDAPEAAEAPERAPRPEPRGRRPRQAAPREGNGAAAHSDDGAAFDLPLPPAISISSDEPVAEEKPRRRRRSAADEVTPVS